MYAPLIDEDVPKIVARMNRAYRGNIGSGRSTKEAYPNGERTTRALLRKDLSRKPWASLLKWQDGGDKNIVGCVA